MKETRNLNNTYTDDEIAEITAKALEPEFPDFESFKKYFDKKIDEALKEIEEGKIIPHEVVMAKLKEEFGIES